MSKLRALPAAVCALLCASLMRGEEPDLPPGPMREKAVAACLGCHDGRIIGQQRLDRRGWAKVLDKMARWGAPVSPADSGAMIDYFARNFRPAESGATAADLAEGPATPKVRAACLGCHDAAIIVQQRLDRRAWTRTLDKMVGWGAVLREEDRNTILDYLVSHYAAAGHSGGNCSWQPLPRGLGP